MPAKRKYSEELRERAVRMVFQVRRETGQRAGTSTADGQRIAELERELRETRRANDILRAAASFFAR